MDLNNINYSLLCSKCKFYNPDAEDVTKCCKGLEPEINRDANPDCEAYDCVLAFKDAISDIELAAELMGDECFSFENIIRILDKK